MMETQTLTNPVNGHIRHIISCAAKNAEAAIVLIHGFGEHGERYAPMMEHFASHGISSLTIDLEGHGRSGDRRGVCKNYDILKADVTLAMDASRRAFPGVPQFLYGHSMGGGLVLNYGLNQSPDVAAYIISAPLIRPAKPVPRLLSGLVRILRGLSPRMTIDNAINGSKVSSILGEQAKYENDPLNHGKLGVGLAVDMIEGGEWVAANADQWEAPLLLLHARGDQLTDFSASQAFAAAADNCTFLPMEDCEHEMHNDVTRDQVYAAMTDFIKSHL